MGTSEYLSTSQLVIMIDEMKIVEVDVLIIMTAYKCLHFSLIIHHLYSFLALHNLQTSGLSQAVLTI